MAKRWKLAALFAQQEVTFALDPSATGSTMKHLKALSDMQFSPMQDVIERDGLVYDLTRQAHAMGAKGGSLSFKLELKGSGTPAGSTIASIAAEADAILNCLFGTTTRQTGSLVVNAGSTTTVVNVTAASGAGFSKYGMVIFDCGANGKHARFITAINVDALTLDRALPSVPANGTTVTASTKFSRANSGHASMCFTAKRAEAAAIEYTLLGCKFDSAKIAGVTTRGTALLELSFSVTDWTATNKGSLPSTVLTGVTAVKGPVIKASCFAVAGTEELAYALDFDFGFKFDFQDSTCAQGPAQPDSVNAGLELVDTTIQGNIKSYHKLQHLIDFFAGNQVSVAFAAIDQNNLGSAWGLYCINAQYTGHAFEDHAGMVGEHLPFKVNDNSTDPDFVLCVA